MSSEALLGLIKQKFSPNENRIIVQSLSQDPLIWQFIQNEALSLPYFLSAPADLESYSPGSIAKWHIEQKTGISFELEKNQKAQLPQKLRQMAGQAFETVINTGLPPTDLFTAGLLALALRERRLIKDSWIGIADDIFSKGDFRSPEKLFQTWRTPIVCLFHFSSDFNDLIAEFLPSKLSWVETAAAPIFISAYLSNPMENKDLEDNLFNLTQRLSIDLQLESLHWLAQFHRLKISQALSKHLLQTRSNIEYFSRTFSELEAFDTSNQSNDPLNKKVRYTLPEDTNRLAAFYHYSGDNQKAAETYQRSSDLLEFLRSQILFQYNISEGGNSSPYKWMQILKSVPNTTQSRYHFIRELIGSKKFSEAEEYLEKIKDSPEKEYLLFLRQSVDNGAKDASPDYKALLPEIHQENDFLIPSYYVHPVNIDYRESLLKFAKETGSDQNMDWVAKLLENALPDLKIVELARDYYETRNEFTKATELTAYLESLEPEEKTHKQDLARLYCSANRWKDAFVSLQELIKSETKPEIKDLERFAESAIKTDHADMGISICHNILKQEPHNSKALILLGESYMEKGDLVKAIQHMEQVVEMIPEEADTWLTLSRIWQENGQSDRAFEVLSKGVLAVPNSPELLRSLGKAHLERRAPADALTYLAKAHEIQPENTDGLLYLTQTQHQLGQNKQALQLLEPFESKYQQNPRIAKVLGLVLLAMDDQASAEPKLLIAASHFPEDVKTVLTTADLILTQQELSPDEPDVEKLEKLENILKNALDIDQDNFQYRLALADIKRLKGNNDQAVEAYRQLAEVSSPDMDTSQWHLSYGLGKSATAMGDLDLGLAAIQDASTKKPGNVMVLHALAEAYQANEFNDKAKFTAKLTLKLAPQNINNVLWYADFMTKNNEVNEALKALKEALQMNPNRSDLQIRLARTYLTNGSIDDSIKTIKDIIHYQNSNSKDLQNAGYLCIELNESELALKALEKASILANEFDPSLIMDLAYSYALNNQPTKAIETLDIHQNAFETNPELAILKSDFLSNLGHYSQAFNLLKELIEVDGDEIKIEETNSSAMSHSPLLYAVDFSTKAQLQRYGLLARSLGYFSEAQTALMKAHTLFPEDNVIIRDLVESYLSVLAFDKALSIINSITEKSTVSDKLLDIGLLSNQFMIKRIQGAGKNKNGLVQKAMDVENKTPRLLAELSLIASEDHEIDLAKQHYQDAINQYQQYYGHPTSSLNAEFDHFMTLSSLAEAALNVGNFNSALEYHQKASSIFNNQPYQIWRYILNLIDCAESHQKAKILLIKEHAPGNWAISQENLEQTQALIDQISEFLPEDQLVCLKAKAIAAFTGTWPLSLNADACLVGPKEAAAVIISTDDDEFIQDILGAYPESLDVLQAFGLYGLKNNVSSTIPLIEKALRMDIHNPISYAILAFLQKNDPKLSINSLETALEFWPNEPEWHVRAADLHKSIGNTELAAKHIQQALSLCPENGTYWEKSGELKFNLNQLNEAKEDLEKSVSLKSQDPMTWMKMANVNRRLGNSPEAIENIHKASELDPSNINFLEQEIKIMLDQQRFADAEARSSTLLGQNPTNEQMRILLAKSQSKQGKFDDALQTLASTSKTGKDAPELKLETIKIKKEQQGIEANLPKLIKLAEENPDNASVLITLTDWLIQTNRLKKAEETAQTIARILPEQAEVHLMLGRLQRKNGQLDQAVAHLSDAIGADPYLVEAYIELGKTYQDRKNLEEAIKVYQKASQANPADARPYFHAGMAMKECKNYADAETMLKQAKKYSPDDPNIIRQLGVITALNLIHNLRETK